MTHTPGEIAAGKALRKIVYPGGAEPRDDLDDGAMLDDWIADAMTVVGAYRDAEPCRWRLDNEGDWSVWMSGCGGAWQFEDGGPKENHCNFCHSCGRQIEVTP